MQPIRHQMTSPVPGHCVQRHRADFYKNLSHNFSGWLLSGLNGWLLSSLYGDTAAGLTGDMQQSLRRLGDWYGLN